MDEEVESQPQSRTSFATRFFEQSHRYKKFLFKFWWILLLTVAAADGVQLYLLRHVPPFFVSEGRMIVNVKILVPNANVYSEEVANFFGTQVALMQSESVIYRVRTNLAAVNPELQPVPVSIAVALTPKTSIFNLQASGSDASYTQAYLQATMEEYIKLKQKLLGDASTSTESTMQQELKTMGEELTKSKQDVEEYQASNSVVLLEPNGGNSAAERLADLNRDLDKLKSELHQLKTLTLDENLERQQGLFTQPETSANPPTSNAPEKKPTPPAPPQNTISLPAQNAGGNAEVKNDAALNYTTTQLGTFEADYLRTKRQIILLKAARKDLIETHHLATNAAEVISKDHDIAQEEANLKVDEEQSQQQLLNRQHTLELEIKDAQAQAKDYEARALDVNMKLTRYQELKENNKRLQTIYDDRLATLQTIDMNKGIGQESVTILEPASHALPLPSDRKKRLIMASLIGFFLGIGILALIDRLDDRPGTLSELEKLFELPVLGQFPLVKAPNKNEDVPILQLDDDRHALVEAYRTLRSALLFSHSQKTHPKSIVITSASPNDGKSMTSANFAITLAQAGARVLLVDADLRRGVLHKHFYVSASPGLAEALAGTRPWSESLVATPIPNLHLLPRGIMPSRHGNMFAHSGKLFGEMAEHYDYFVFDTAPVLVADDVLSLAPHADGLIMVIRAGFTSSRVTHAALNLLRLRKVNVVGLVFNAVHPKSSDYYYGRYKDYYEQPDPA